MSYGDMLGLRRACPRVGSAAFDLAGRADCVRRRALLSLRDRSAQQRYVVACVGLAAMVAAWIGTAVVVNQTLELAPARLVMAQAPPGGAWPRGPRRPHPGNPGDRVARGPGPRGRTKAAAAADGGMVVDDCFAVAGRRRPSVRTPGARLDGRGAAATVQYAAVSERHERVAEAARLRDRPRGARRAVGGGAGAAGGRMAAADRDAAGERADRPVAGAARVDHRARTRAHQAARLSGERPPIGGGGAATTTGVLVDLAPDSHRREHCCDDIAVALCGDGVTYASALADLELHRHTAGFALAATDGPLLQRVRRVIAPESEHRPAGWAESRQSRCSGDPVAGAQAAGRAAIAESAQAPVPTVGRTVPAGEAVLQGRVVEASSAVRWLVPPCRRWNPTAPPKPGPTTTAGTDGGLEAWAATPSRSAPKASCRPTTARAARP